MRYLRPASSDSRRWVSSAQRTYSEIENHSSARNIVMRFAAETKNTIPAAEAASSA